MMYRYDVNMQGLVPALCQAGQKSKVNEREIGARAVQLRKRKATIDSAHILTHFDWSYGMSYTLCSYVLNKD